MTQVVGTYAKGSQLPGFFSCCIIISHYLSYFMNNKTQLCIPRTISDVYPSLPCVSSSPFEQLYILLQGKLSDTIMGYPALKLWILDKQHKHLMIQQGCAGAAQEAIQGLLLCLQGASKPSPFMEISLPSCVSFLSLFSRWPTPSLLGGNRLQWPALHLPLHS